MQWRDDTTPQLALGGSPLEPDAKCPRLVRLFRMLSVRRERPRCGAAEQRDELRRFIQ